MEQRLPTNDEVLQYQERAVYAGVWHSCLNCNDCHHSADGAPRCARANLAVPPLATLVVGCPAWSERIPF